MNEEVSQDTQSQSVVEQIATQETKVDVAAGGVTAETMLDKTNAELANTVVAEATPQSPAAPLTKTEAPQFTADASAVIQTGIGADGLAGGIQTEAALVEAVDAHFSTTGKILYQSVVDYTLKMAPKMPLDPVVGARHQVGLYRAISSMINDLDEDFNAVFGALLKLVNTHSAGVFHETHAFRFMETITLPERDRKSFQRLLNLIKQTSDGQSREAALRQIDLNKTLEFFSEESRQKVFAFYGK